MDGEYLTVGEAAHILRVSHWTLRIWLRNNKHGITAKRAGRRLLLNKADLQNFVQASTMHAAALREQSTDSDQTVSV